MTFPIDPLSINKGIALTEKRKYMMLSRVSSFQIAIYSASLGHSLGEYIYIASEWIDMAGSTGER